MPEFNAIQLIEQWCDKEGGSLNLRYVNGQWQAQLTKHDGSFSRNAFSSNVNEVFATLVEAL